MNRQILTDLLRKRDFKAVRSILEVMYTVDIAALLAELDDKEMILAFRLIEKAKAAEVFAEMSSSMQAYLVEMFTEKELKELLDELYMDDTVDLLEELPANLVTRILEQVDREKKGADQHDSQLSGGQRRKHNDDRVCGSASYHHSSGSNGTHQTDRDS